MADSIPLKCAKCGSDKFQVPSDRPPEPGDIIRCAGCNAESRYDTIQREAVEQAQELFSKMFRDALKDVPGVTFK